MSNNQRVYLWHSKVQCLYGLYRRASTKGLASIAKILDLPTCASQDGKSQNSWAKWKMCCLAQFSHIFTQSTD